MASQGEACLIQVSSLQASRACAEHCDQPTWPSLSLPAGSCRANMRLVCSGARWVHRAAPSPGTEHAGSDSWCMMQAALCAPAAAAALRAALNGQTYTASLSDVHNASPTGWQQCSEAAADTHHTSCTLPSIARHRSRSRSKSPATAAAKQRSLPCVERRSHAKQQSTPNASQHQQATQAKRLKATGAEKPSPNPCASVKSTAKRAQHVVSQPKQCQQKDSRSLLGQDADACLQKHKPAFVFGSAPPAAPHHSIMQSHQADAQQQGSKANAPRDNVQWHCTAATMLSSKAHSFAQSPRRLEPIPVRSHTPDQRHTRAERPLSAKHSCMQPQSEPAATLRKPSAAFAATPRWEQPNAQRARSSRSSPQLPHVQPCSQDAHEAAQQLIKPRTPAATFAPPQTTPGARAHKSVASAAGPTGSSTDYVTPSDRYTKPHAPAASFAPARKRHVRDSADSIARTSLLRPGTAASADCSPGPGSYSAAASKFAARSTRVPGPRCGASSREKAARPQDSACSFAADGDSCLAAARAKAALRTRTRGVLAWHCSGSSVKTLRRNAADVARGSSQQVSSQRKHAAVERRVPGGKFAGRMSAPPSRAHVEAPFRGSAALEAPARPRMALIAPRHPAWKFAPTESGHRVGGNLDADADALDADGRLWPEPLALRRRLDIGSAVFGVLRCAHNTSTCTAACGSWKLAHLYAGMSTARHACVSWPACYCVASNCRTTLTCRAGVSCFKDSSQEQSFCRDLAHSVTPQAQHLVTLNTLQAWLATQPSAPAAFIAAASAHGLQAQTFRNSDPGHGPSLMLGVAAAWQAANSATPAHTIAPLPVHAEHARLLKRLMCSDPLADLPLLPNALRGTQLIHPKDTVLFTKQLASICFAAPAAHRLPASDGSSTDEGHGPLQLRYTVVETRACAVDFSRGAPHQCMLEEVRCITSCDGIADDVRMLYMHLRHLEHLVPLLAHQACKPLLSGHADHR